ncbi:MAG: RNA polymerase subunit sigma [Gammaproteobacteria bacterium]|nr:sigma-70 family RNA polymerase sigma factor [Gammaproteobacteria bacterium]PCH63863.1 MAG: RNA polymerase subunit sigma [Gammaproteobacteria bacterium]
MTTTQLSANLDPASWLRDHGDYLYRYALMRLRDQSTAEDTVQETLLAALKAKENFRGDSAVRTWLVGIMKYKIIDYYRKSGREIQSESIEQTLSSDNDDFSESGHWSTPVNSWSDPDAALNQDQFFEVYQGCLDALPNDQARLFILNETSDLSSEELCKIMNISTTNNLWVILSRTRKRLRDCIDKNWFNTE